LSGASTADSDGQQGAVDAPDRAEQADEGGRGADGSQGGQARLQAGGFLVQHLLDGAGNEVVGAASLGQLGRTMAGVVGLGMQGMGAQVRKGVTGAVGADLGLHCLE